MKDVMLFPMLLVSRKYRIHITGHIYGIFIFKIIWQNNPLKCKNYRRITLFYVMKVYCTGTRSHQVAK